MTKIMFLNRNVLKRAIICAGLLFVWSSTSAQVEPSEEWVDPQEVLKLGNKGDKASVPYLKKIRGKSDENVAGKAQMALAKLGEQKEMQEIVNEAKSADPEVQKRAIGKLEYIGNKAAIRALIALLNDTEYKERQSKKTSKVKTRKTRELYEPPAYLAIQALAKIVADGPKPKEKFLTKADAVEWKKWWESNRKKYE